MSATATANEMTLVRASDGKALARVEVARGFVGRFLGLMFRRRLEPGAALWLEPCSSIHMMFMRFAIDVAFLDPEGRVLKVAPRVRPWLGLAACSGARTAVELEAGAAERAGLAPGDVLRLTRGAA